MTNLQKLQNKIKSLGLDFFILPNADEFMNEYLPESAKRLPFITNFTGSNALTIVGLGKSAFFTDGRYTIQAENEVDSDAFEIFNLADKSPLIWLLENSNQNSKIGIDPKLHSINSLKKYQNNLLGELVFLDKNPVDQIWLEKDLGHLSGIFIHNKKYCGESVENKLNKIINSFSKNADALALNSPASICWLFNIRGNDVSYTPLVLCYVTIYANGKIDLFIDESRLTTEIKNHLNSTKYKISIHQIEDFSIRQSVEKVQLDFNQANFWLYDLVQKQNIEVINKTDPCLILKAIKNKVEVDGAIKAHKIDGLALTKFLFWLENSIKDGVRINEISASKKLLEFRQENSEFCYPSFETISGFGSNGAIVHYCANEKTNKEITQDSLYLCDSGGQYLFGTTDVTRTISIGLPSKEMIADFTRVLKGHINIARAKFPAGTSGSALDTLARFPLWQDGKDYDHGTGHGVGSFLSVHEGPQGISKRSSNVALEKNMIISNEPGYYKEGEYGIRIENLVLVEKYLGDSSKEFLKFKTLTLAPLDLKLIDFSMLTYPEKLWLKNYHQEVFEILKGDLNDREKIWLENIYKNTL